MTHHHTVRMNAFKYKKTELDLRRIIAWSADRRAYTNMYSSTCPQLSKGVQYKLHLIQCI